MPPKGKGFKQHPLANKGGKSGASGKKKTSSKDDADDAFLDQAMAANEARRRQEPKPTSTRRGGGTPPPQFNGIRNTSSGMPTGREELRQAAAEECLHREITAEVALVKRHWVEDRLPALPEVQPDLVEMCLWRPLEHWNCPTPAERRIVFPGHSKWGSTDVFEEFIEILPGQIYHSDILWKKAGRVIKPEQLESLAATAKAVWEKRCPSEKCYGCKQPIPTRWRGDPPSCVCGQTFCGDACHSEYWPSHRMECQAFEEETGAYCWLNAKYWEMVLCGFLPFKDQPDWARMWKKKGVDDSIREINFYLVHEPQYWQALFVAPLSSAGGPDLGRVGSVKIRQRMMLKSISSRDSAARLAAKYIQLKAFEEEQANMLSMLLYKGNPPRDETKWAHPLRRLKQAAERSRTTSGDLGKDFLEKEQLKFRRPVVSKSAQAPAKRRYHVGSRHEPEEDMDECGIPAVWCNVHIKCPEVPLPAFVTRDTLGVNLDQALDEFHERKRGQPTKKKAGSKYPARALFPGRSRWLEISDFSEIYWSFHKEFEPGMTELTEESVAEMISHIGPSLIVYRAERDLGVSFEKVYEDAHRDALGSVDMPREEEMDLLMSCGLTMKFTVEQHRSLLSPLGVTIETDLSDDRKECIANALAFGDFKLSSAEPKPVVQCAGCKVELEDSDPPECICFLRYCSDKCHADDWPRHHSECAKWLDKNSGSIVEMLTAAYWMMVYLGMLPRKEQPHFPSLWKEAAGVHAGSPLQELAFYRKYESQYIKDSAKRFKVVASKVSDAVHLAFVVETIGASRFQYSNPLATDSYARLAFKWEKMKRFRETQNAMAIQQFGALPSEKEAWKKFQPMLRAARTNLGLRATGRLYGDDSVKEVYSDNEWSDEEEETDEWETDEELELD